MKLSIVTPSFNQARFLEACVDSVLNQGYPDLEYLVMDGGSSDLTVEILKTYGDRVSWVSEPDGGQAAAVNKGIERASGDIIGWLNSDDIYYPGSFEAVMEVFDNNPNVNVVYGHADHIKEDGSYLEDYYTEPWDYERLKEICYICQPAVFFRKKTVEQVGMLNPNRKYAMDYDLWLRMGKTETFYFLNRKLAGSRLYSTNKTLGFVEPVHLDIMDTVLQNTGSIPERWLRGSAESVAVSKGYTFNTSEEYREYSAFVAKKIFEYSERFNYNEEKVLNKQPYAFSTALKIGIDASMAFQEKIVGVGGTAKEIIRSLANGYSDTDYMVYPAMEDHIDPYCLENDCFKSISNIKYAFYGSDYGMVNHLCVQFGEQNLDEIDKLCGYPNVVLYPSFTFSCALAQRCASVYVIYDISFLEHIEYTTEANFDYCFKHMFNAAMKADYFIAISDYSRNMFLEYFPFVKPELVRVAHLGCKEVYKNNPQRQEYFQINIDTDVKFWLFVGTIEPRKNLLSLLYAYAELKKRDITMPLYIAGGTGWKNSHIYKTVEKLGLEQYVQFLGYVTDEQLNLLYHCCYAMIYPSHYEGFGLPILEAMTAGAPVITSNTTSMPEVGGDAVIYIEPDNIKSIADAMYMLYKHPERREEMKKKGFIQSQKFGWNKTAEVIQRTLVDAVVNRRENRNSS